MKVLAARHNALQGAEASSHKTIASINPGQILIATSTLIRGGSSPEMQGMDVTA